MAHETLDQYWARMRRDPPVTIETVGRKAFLADPIAHKAVRAGISQAEFIRILLAENQQLRRSLEDALQRSYMPLFMLESEGNR